MEITGAGCVPFSWVDAADGVEVRFLFYTRQSGKKTGLIDFGGKMDASVDQSVIHCATREFAEETGGVFGTTTSEKSTSLADQINNSADYSLQQILMLADGALPGPFVHPVSGYTWFLLPLPFIDGATLEARVNEHITDPGKKRSFHWISAADLVARQAEVFERVDCSILCANINRIQAYVASRSGQTTAGAGPIQGDAAPTKRYAVIDTEDLPLYRNLETLFYSAFREDGEQWSVYRAYNHHFPTESELNSLQGLIITGSHYCVYDDSLSWLPPLFDVIRYCAKKGYTKVLGVCFGAQALGRALGGEVGRNTAGPVCKCEILQPTDQLFAQPFIQRLLSSNVISSSLKSLRIFEAHGDAVLSLPADAMLLASSSTCPVEMWTLGENILAVQGHPEFTMALMRNKILPDMMAEGVVCASTADTTLNDEADTAVLRQILLSFLKT
eukprot:GILJ01004696.1.p1 GENE.GILJ01004696.1~~GILJ01004696.1.p1  ORF type:complete len:444 (-),score=56.86 GILJ01004696.1:113-1444(-)